MMTAGCRALSSPIFASVVYDEDKNSLRCPAVKVNRMLIDQCTGSPQREPRYKNTKQATPHSAGWPSADVSPRTTKHRHSEGLPDTQRESERRDHAPHTTLARRPFVRQTKDEPCPHEGKCLKHTYTQRDTRTHTHLSRNVAEDTEAGRYRCRSLLMGDAPYTTSPTR